MSCIHEMSQDSWVITGIIDYFNEEDTMVQTMQGATARNDRTYGISRFPKRLATGLLTGALLLLPLSPALAETTIRILSPKNGATVPGKVTVKYAYHKEGRANHVHIFVDGNFLEATHDDPVTLDLPSGHHTILLRAASRHHDLLKARASVDVDVK